VNHQERERVDNLLHRINELQAQGGSLRLRLGEVIRERDALLVRVENQRQEIERLHLLNPEGLQLLTPSTSREWIKGEPFEPEVVEIERTPQSISWTEAIEQPPVRPKPPPPPRPPPSRLSCPACGPLGDEDHPLPHRSWGCRLVIFFQGGKVREEEREIRRQHRARMRSRPAYQFQSDQPEGKR